MFVKTDGKMTNANDFVEMKQLHAAPRQLSAISPPTREDGDVSFSQLNLPIYQYSVIIILSTYLYVH